MTDGHTSRGDDCRLDVGMEELATLLLAPDRGGGLHPESDGRWAPWRQPGADQPPDAPPGTATEFGHSGLERDVPVRGGLYHLKRQSSTRLSCMDRRLDLVLYVALQHAAVHMLLNFRSSLLDVLACLSSVGNRFGRMPVRIAHAIADLCR